MPLSEWEFFHILEGHLSDALRSLIGEGGVQILCPREVVKYVEKNYDSIFPLSVQSSLSFSSGAFMSIRQVLNAKHHRLERQWAFVDEVIAQSIRILKDLEKFNIATAEGVKELESLWPKVDKSELAFSNRNNLLLAKVTNLPPFPNLGTVLTPKGVKVSLAVPEGIPPNDIVEFLRDIQEIPLTDVSVSEKGTISFGVSSPSDVESILPEFMYAKKKMCVQLIQNISLVLHPVPDTKTADHIRLSLKSMDILPLSVQEPDRKNKTVVVELSSKEDEDYIRQHGIIVKPQALRVLENHTTPYVVYLDSPAKSLEVFKVLWENHFGFLPENICFSSNLKSFAFVLDTNQSNRVIRAPAFKVNCRKALVVPYSPCRVTMTFSSPMDSERVQAAIGALLPVSSFSLHVPFDNSDENDNTNKDNNFLLAYVHTVDASAKQTLLTKEIRIAPFKPPTHFLSTPTVTHTTPTPAPSSPSSTPPPLLNTPQTSPSSAKQQSTSSKTFSVCVSKGELGANTALGTVRASLMDESRKRGAKWSVLFIFEREGKFYADIFCEKPELADQVKTISVGKKQAAVRRIDEAPYYLIKLENVPPSIDNYRLLDYFKHAKINVGQITKSHDYAIVSMNYADYQIFLKKKYIVIDSATITVTEATIPVSTKPQEKIATQVSREIKLKFIEGQFLYKKKKEELSNIASEQCVKIHITKQNNVLIQGSNFANVDQAAENVTFIINENSSKFLNLKFHCEPLVNLAQTKVLRSLSEFESHDIIYYVKKISSTALTVSLCGTPSSVEEAEQTVNTTKSLTSHEIAVPPDLELDFAALESKFDIQAEFDKQADKLTIFGSKESVAELADHIQAKISNTKTTAHIKLDREHQQFLQKFTFSDRKWTAMMHELGIELKFNEGSGSVTIKGNHANMKTMKDEIVKLQAAVVDNKIQITINKHMFNLLEEHVKEHLGAVAHCTVRTVPATKGSLYDDGDLDDASSTSSDISVGTSFSNTSSTSTTSLNSMTKEQEKMNQITAEVGAWYFSNHEAQVSQVFEGLRKGVEVQKIKYTPDDIPTIRKAYDFSHIQKRNKVHVFNCVSANVLIVSGFSSELVTKARGVIEKDIERSANKIETIPLEKHVFFFFKQKREMFLAQLKHQLNLKQVELTQNKPIVPTNANANFPYSKDSYANLHNKKNPPQQILRSAKYNIVVEGNPTKVERLKQEIANITVHHEVVKVQYGTATSLKEFEEELKQTYDVTTLVKDLQPTFEFSVTGETSLPWKEILEKLDSLKGVSEDFKPSDYSRLAEIVLINKELDLKAFKKEYNLFKKPYFNEDKSTILLVAQKKEDIRAASAALEGVLSNKRIETISLEIYENKYVHFFTSGGSNAKRVAYIIKKYNLTYQWKYKSLVIRGPKDILSKASAELQSTIAEAIGNIKTKSIQLSSYIASELTKDNNKMCKDCLASSGVLITFPDTSTDSPDNVVEFIVTTSNCIVQVVRGDITREPTKCIVNAANANLVHSGGVARDIAQKAGEGFEKECARVVAMQGPVAVGSCVITSAGNIQQPIEHVIHTVGPQWYGGLSSEAHMLAQTIKATLKLAEEQSIPSISLPTISGGIFGYPIQECTNIITQEVFKFASTRSAASKLKHIRICEKDPAVVTHLEASLKSAASGTGSKQEDLGLVYQWSWMVDLARKTWQPFDPNENFQIELAYLKQRRKGKMETVVTGDVNQVKNGFTYEIDFDEMTELNTKYRVTRRPIKREPIKQTMNFSWEIQNAKGEWVKFGALENQQIEWAFFQKVPTMTLRLQNQQFLLDFQHMREKNSNLKLHRADTFYETQLQNRNKEFMEQLEKKPEEPNQPQSEEDDTVQCFLLGQAQDLPKGEKWIQDKIIEMTTSEIVYFEHNVPATVAKELSSIKKKYGVRAQSEKNKITITGLRMQVVQAKTEILEIERSSSYTFKKPPHYWEPQKEDCEEKEVKSSSEEWLKIEKRIGETIANAKISKIQRIQNVSQWEKYCFLKDRISRKNNNDPQEAYLFHGTRSNLPSLIYTGDDGFDMRYSSAGFWGRASYFAKNASYSHKYAYKLPNGHHQLFFARVVVGKNKHIPSNANLIKPPDGFDSVSGETGNSIVYMVYENGRAYPEYLVTYSV